MNEKDLLPIAQPITGWAAFATSGALIAYGATGSPQTAMIAAGVGGAVGWFAGASFLPGNQAKPAPQAGRQFAAPIKLTVLEEAGNAGEFIEIENIPPERLTAACKSCVECDFRFAYSTMVSPAGLSRQQFDKLRRLFIRRGLLLARNRHSFNQGYSLSGKGRAAVRAIANHPPTIGDFAAKIIKSLE